MQTMKSWAWTFLQMVAWVLVLTMMVVACGSACKASPVKLMSVEYANKMVFGSCVHIGNGVYMTARHMFEYPPNAAPEDMDLKIYDDLAEVQEHAATYGSIYSPVDLAYFTSDHVASEAYTIKPSQDYTSAAPFTLIGWEIETSPELGTLTASDNDFMFVTREGGEFVAEWREHNRVLGAHLTCDAHSGNSGGAIIDSNHYLIGIVSSRLDAEGTRYHSDCLSASGVAFMEVCNEIRTTCPVHKVPLFVWSQESCGPCQRFENDLNDVGKNTNFRELLEERYELVKIPMDGRPYIGFHILPRMSITTTPTFVRGDLGTRNVGYRGMEELLVWLGIDPRRLEEAAQPIPINPPPEATPPQPEISTPPISSEPPVPEVTTPPVPEPEPTPEPPVTVPEPVPTPEPEVPPQINTPPPVVESGPSFFSVLGGAFLHHLPTVLGVGAAAVGVATPVGLAGWGAWALVGLAKRRIKRYRSRPKSQPTTQPNAGEGVICHCSPQGPEECEPQVPGGACPNVPFPRKLDEASQLLQLAATENGGSIPVVDALKGRLFQDEVSRLLESSSTTDAEKIVLRKLSSTLDERVNEIAPLTV